MCNQVFVSNKPITAETQAQFLLDTVAPLLNICTSVTLVKAMRRVRESEYSEIRNLLLPEFEQWLKGLPNEQMTWLGDDLAEIAPILAGQVYPELKTTIGAVIRKFGTDRPKALAEGIFEYAKELLSLFEASLFTFTLVYMVKPDLYPPLPSKEENKNG